MRKWDSKKMKLKTFVPNLKRWIGRYVGQFASVDPDIQAALDLKLAHTRRVSDAAKDIGKSEGLFGEALHMAEVTALLHDIGRFEQFQKYKTFSDAKSEDHAALGVHVIQKEGILQSIEDEKAQIILEAVRCHNKAALPVTENATGLFFMKLLRDADKVDIWYVVTDYYRRAHERRNETLELNLPDAPWVSDAVCRSLMEGDIVQMKDMRTLNDFKLLQLGWIYDVNFKRTFEIVKERRYLEQIRGALPEKSIPIDAVYQRALAYLDEKTGDTQTKKGAAP
ncbi:HD domain protein [delta proteobacterium NaphS2]|nr:HD domain protein [delta proteobacterium NaphS2]